MIATIIKIQHKKDLKHDDAVSFYTVTENNSLPSHKDVLDEAEFDFAKTHLNRIKKLAIKAEDMVLVAVSMSGDSWLQVIDACIYAGANFILADPVAEASSLASTIEKEKVTVVATMPRVWNYIYRDLNAKMREIKKSLRAILFNDCGELESSHYLIPAALSK